MPDERVHDVKFEIGHVLFCDIVGYSKLLITEQADLLRKLTGIVRNTEQFRSAEAADNLLRLPTGDGMALVFRGSPEAAVKCALELSKSLQAQPDLRVRMGIHSGPVNDVIDVNERTNVTGAGINMAQRVMDCGDAGHILFSKRLADDLEQYPQWRPHLHDLGECEIKHGERLHLFNFYGDGFGNARVPVRFQAGSNAKSYAAGKKSTLTIAIVVLLVLVASSFLSRSGILGRVFVQPAPAAPEKSIAVLPFENLSDEKSNAYFVDGIQDEILTRLAKVADLKVLSRTSTEQFRSKPENLADIARRLGVAHILEGSAQRSTGQVRVNVQLINAATDAHIWAQTYDRKLTDVFGVETEIATKIASTLQAKLSSAEHQAIAARPTENIEAHDLYLRGRFLAGKRTAGDLKQAIDYYSQAIAKDPKYALAYAGMAISYSLLSQFSQFSSEQATAALVKARSAADKALAIDPNLAEAHAALGFILVEGTFNFKEAKREFERAIELNPNSIDARYFYGISVLAPLGLFDDAVSELERAIALDPFSLIMNTNLGFTYTLAKRYPQAIAQHRKTAELAPDFTLNLVGLGEALWLSGNAPDAVTQYQKAIRISRAQGRGLEYHPMALLAQLYGASGHRQQARQLLGEVRRIEQHQGTVWGYGYALIAIGLGDKEKAIDWLEQSYEAKDRSALLDIRFDPLLDPLRGEPRFEKLANQVVSRNAK